MESLYAADGKGFITAETSFQTTSAGADILSKRSPEDALILNGSSESISSHTIYYSLGSVWIGMLYPNWDTEFELECCNQIGMLYLNWDVIHVFELGW